ncbi:MAG: CAP domain-containing protein, partial [Nitrososphaera sp.]
SVILVTAAILTVQSSMLQISYAQTRLDATSQNTILTMHNDARRAVNVPPATWSESLARDAQAWADYIASLNLDLQRCYNGDRTQCPPHATWQQRNSQGENLAWGTRGAFPVARHVQGWLDEAPNCPPGCMIPADGSLGVYPRVYGHYTQIVWNTATQIGCGMASDATQDYLVCRYLQAGNYPNQAPYGQGAAAVGEEQNTLGDQGAAAVGEEQNTLGDQGAVQ